MPASLPWAPDLRPCPEPLPWTPSLNPSLDLWSSLCSELLPWPLWCPELWPEYLSRPWYETPTLSPISWAPALMSCPELLWTPALRFCPETYLQPLPLSRVPALGPAGKADIVQYGDDTQDLISGRPWDMFPSLFLGKRRSLNFPTGLATTVQRSTQIKHSSFSRLPTKHLTSSTCLCKIGEAGEEPPP